ncbi:hypothetical protein P0D92_03170 [Pseudomonas sp. CBSPAW29]|nr:hypothetical protein P0D92_03170 [Pseudomonas sp. CBSPAW29]
MQQQGLRVARQLAGGQQVSLAEGIQVYQAGAQVLRQLCRQFIQMLQQVFQALAGAAQAQGVAAGEVIVDIARGLVLEGLRQAQVALHQQIRPLQGALRPPERRAQGQANGDQKEGVQIRQQLQAHAWFQPTAEVSA